MTLNVFKIITGEIVIGEIINYDSIGISINNPLIMESIEVQGQHANTLSMLLPGAIDETITLKHPHIITHSLAGSQLRKFYGESIFRFFVKNKIALSVDNGSEQLDNYNKIIIFEKHKELKTKYGIDETDFSITHAPSRTLH